MGQEEALESIHPEGSAMNQYVSVIVNSTLSIIKLIDQGMEMQEQNCENLKSSSYQPPIVPNQTVMNTHAQLYVNEPDRYLPIANIGRIMKNTLDPPKEKKRRRGQKPNKKQNKASIDRHFNDPDEEFKD